jgi:hypothetical protein
MQAEQYGVLPEHTVKKAWEGLISAEIRGYYFAELVRRSRRLLKMLTWTILICSSGASLAIIDHWNSQWPKMALSLIVTGLSIFLLVQRYEDRAARCSDLHLEWGEIANGYECIWKNMYAEDTEEKLRGLAQRELKLSKSSLDIGDDNKLLLKCQDYAENLR